MSTINMDRYRTMLLEERGRVEEALKRLHEDHSGTIDEETEEISGTSDNHLGDTATATLNREIDYTLEENAGQVLGEIDAALKRLDDGTYGTCVRCGRPIGEERLEARPWALLCIDDQRAQERR
jgi:RNA polymerase-binding protein DksA